MFWTDVSDRAFKNEEQKLNAVAHPSRTYVHFDTGSCTIWTAWNDSQSLIHQYMRSAWVFSCCRRCSEHSCVQNLFNFEITESDTHEAPPQKWEFHDHRNHTDRAT